MKWDTLVPMAIRNGYTINYPLFLAKARTCLKASHPLKRAGNDPEHYY